MPLIWLTATVLAIASIGFFLGRDRAMQSTGGDLRELHSLPAYYGWNVPLKSAGPGFGLMKRWLQAQPH